MKVKHYNEMMAYLTRPGFNGGGSVSNRTVLPKRKPAEEVKKRKKINYEKIKQYLGKESQELIERELGFAIGGGVNPSQLKQRFMQLVASIQDADEAEIPSIVAQAKQIKDQIDDLNQELAPERQIKLTAEGLQFDNPLVDAANIQRSVEPIQPVKKAIASITKDNPALAAVPDFERGTKGTLADPEEKQDPKKKIAATPKGNVVQAAMKMNRQNVSKTIRDYMKTRDLYEAPEVYPEIKTEDAFADGGRIGFEPGGKVQLKNQVKLDNLKKLVLAYNNNPKALYDTTGKMKSANAFSKNKILIEAGFEKGMLSLDARTGLGKAVDKEIKKLLKPAQKFENYMNNIMLAEDALAKDFINPRAHVAKKFGLSYDSEQIKNFFAGKNSNKTVKENSKLFKTVLSQKLARDIYLYAPDGSPRTMAEVSELVANKLPSKFGVIVEDSPHKFILESARRNFLKNQKLGLEPKVTFITNPETTAPRDLVFIDNESGKLYSSNLQEEFFEYQGKKYKNNYLLKDNARQLYPEFESIYKIFEEDIPEYKKATVMIDGKERNLDQYYRDKYAKESGSKSYYTRRSAEVDHGNILDDPFGRKKYGFNQGGIRLIGAKENRQAGMLILNKSKNLKGNLETIGFINNDQSTTDFINRMKDNATKKGVIFRKGKPVTLGSNFANVTPDLLDFRKLPDDVRNVSDVIRNLIKTPAGKRIARNLIKAGKFTGYGLASEVAFAAPFALDDYASGLEGDRILGNATLGFFGETEQEEIKKATGELGYATQTIEELGSVIPEIEKKYKSYSDENDPRGEKRQQFLNLYNSTIDRYNKAYNLFVTDEGNFDKELYNQGVTNYAAGLGQIEKFRAAKEKERGIKGEVTGFEMADPYNPNNVQLDLSFLGGNPLEPKRIDKAGGGIAKEGGVKSGVAPESGPTPDGPKGLFSAIKYVKKS